MIGHRSEGAVFVVIAEPDWARLRRLLLEDESRETLGVLFCGIASAGNWFRYYVREVWETPREAYEERHRYHLRIAPRFFNSVVDHALSTRLTPILIHSHPGGGPAAYSLSDDWGETRLLPVLEQLLPSRYPASLVVTREDASGRRWANGSFVKIESLEVRGRRRRRFGDRRETLHAGDEFDRQIRAIGQEGQRILEELKVAIVGVGGIGSAVAEQVVRLGVRDMLIIDPDVFELSNFSRVWGSHRDDSSAHRLKVDIVRRHLEAIGRDVAIRCIARSIVSQSVLLELRDRDLVFGCTDNHLSRAMLNRFAHQYLTPVVDMGVRLDARKGQVTAVGGRVTLVGAGLTCLRCSGHIDPDVIRAESLPDDERRSLALENYVIGLEDPAPSVISLNTTVAGLGVTAAMSIVVDLVGKPPPTDQIYDATEGVVFTIQPRHEESCDVCSEVAGIKGLGDLQAVCAYD